MSAVRYLDIDVNTAARQRINRLFDDFDNVLVAFSGGKDSGVCVNLTLQVAAERGALHRVGVYHLDYEAGYQATVDYVRRAFDALPAGVRGYWLCVPMRVPCAASMHQSEWVPWNPAEKHLWVRDIPDHPVVVTGGPWLRAGDLDYDVQVRFGKWFAAEHGPTAAVIGIRTQESLHRYAAIAGKKRHRFHAGLRWTTPIGKDLINAYPIYDWETSDIWAANARYGWDYNRLYDLMYQAGVPVEAMRVASPFLSQGQEALKLYRVIEPDTWARMIGRVNGVNFTAMYGGTTAMGWRDITKPDGFTWKEYFDFLVSTLPDAARDTILAKIEKSQWHWREQGAGRDERFITQLEAEGVPVIRTGQSSNRTSDAKEIVRIPDYLDDTNVTDFMAAPSWKRACIAVMKNDFIGLSMGFGRTKAEAAARRRAIDLWENTL